MKKGVLIGTVAGFVAGAAAAIAGSVATHKVVKEVKSDMKEQRFPSPEEDRCVTISCGTSKSVKGVTFIRVKAFFDSDEDCCKLSLVARKQPVAIDVQWTDNDHCKLLVGNGKRRQCCDVRFEEGHVYANYYVAKKS